MSNTKIIIILLVVLVAACLAPFVFTRPALCEWFSFSSTGQIGDTIGGITAPIIGLCSIILLIFTLKAQLDFNRKQSKDNLISQLACFQQDIINLDGRISYTFYPQEKDNQIENARGIDSFRLLYVYGNNDNTPAICLRQVYYVLDQVKTLSCLCDSYYSLLNHTSAGILPDSFKLFLEVYRDKLSAFLKAFLNDDIKIRTMPIDTFSDNNCPSETQIIKGLADNMLRSSWLKS